MDDDDELSRELRELERALGFDMNSELDLQVAKLFLARGIHTALPYGSHSTGARRSRDDALAIAAATLQAAETDLTAKTFAAAREWIIELLILKDRTRRDHAVAVARGDDELARRVHVGLLELERSCRALVGRLSALEQRM
jgi:hypothetical protein